MALHPQYLVDEKGKRRGVLLTLKDYQELVERAQDVLDGDLIDETPISPSVPWTSVKTKRNKRSRS